MNAASLFRTFVSRTVPFSLLSTALILATVPPALSATKIVTAKLEQAKKNPSSTVKGLPSPAATGPLRILLVDDDVSDNNNIPGDTRKSVSDTVFRKLVADAVGGDKGSWAIETVKANANGPSIDRLRPYSLIIWYTGSSYGGNPDNTSVLSIEDERTVRRYLEETGGAVILISPGYASKVLEQGSTWEESSWPFLKEVLGIRGGRGLAQRFLPGTVTTTQATQFQVGKGSAVESQFSAVNPGGAEVLFTAKLDATKSGGQPAPVATAFSYGRGRIVYVGFTFENLDAKELAPAFQYLLSATGLTPKTSLTASCPPLPASPTMAGQTQDAGPATVQVSGTPTTAVVSWTLPTATILSASLGGAPTVTRAQTAQAPAQAQASSVRVERLVPNAAPVRLNVASPNALNANDPGPLTPGRAETYRVALMDGCNVLGAKEAVFTPPLARDPSGFTASVAADGTVTLTWQEVPGVVNYQITGTELTALVVVRRATEWRSAPLGAGPKQWKVASVYEPGGVLTAASTWPSVTSRRVPTPGRPYLSMPNGPGSIGESTAFYDKQCEGALGDVLRASAKCPDPGWFLATSPNWAQTWDSKYGGDIIPVSWPSASFADLHDLGLGRRVNCTPVGNAASRGTMCWATSHGHIPAPGESPNGVALATAGEQMADIKSLNIIITLAQGAFFGTFEPVRTQHQAGEDGFITASGKRYLTALDSQGPKSVPNACLSCHGGRYDATRKIVVGASLLPLIPANLSFSSPQARANSQEQIRRINQIILDSNPAPAIRTQITTLYNGSPGTPGTPTNDAAVPPGWATQPGLYRQVIAPYCGSCHFAQTGPLNFGTFANVQANKQRIQRAVCVDFSMPHSEQGLRRFWTDGGTVSLPGMLSTILGFPKCPQ